MKWLDEIKEAFRPGPSRLDRQKENMRALECAREHQHSIERLERATDNLRNPLESVHPA